MAKNVTRSEFYGVLGTVSLVVAALLFAAGLGAWKGHGFAVDQVKNQLNKERIYFPAKGSAALDPKEFPGLQQYAGQQVDNGVKAKAFADEFIWVHMMKASGGKSYSEVSAAAMASPQDQKLAALKNTLFQGDMLRTSLLTAYAFSVLGVIAGYAYPLAFAAAAIMLLLSLLSYARAQKS